ncbi:alginate lyase family protein [Hyunsoonleella sp. 2307UL5-6]|uniref:alginate lyase family protein n=1 Tax=Hyunsoonleella sp. 2307UL5-6 TaxID=3384768 RepID=UPI0039BC5EF4
MKFLSVYLVVLGTIFSCETSQEKFSLLNVEKARILNKVEDYSNLKPLTVTDSFCNRSAGTKHDFYSEGDYWWPNPDAKEGAYIRRDGLSNPDNFKHHRKAIIQLNHISGTLASSYIITKDKKHLKQLIPHLEAWFVNPETKMNPNLLYAQAIKGKVTGRGIGIIDTVHLVEVALAIEVLAESNILEQSRLQAIKQWFKEYLNWLTTHAFGILERDNGNNHSVCWAVQVAAFARLVGDNRQLNYCRKFYKTNLLPNQMAIDGSFPKELSRTKPYGYSLFNLDAMSNVCQLLSTKDDNLFDYKTDDGRSIQLGLQFLYPYIKDKSSWPYPKDVMYFKDWPVRQSALLFGGIHFKNNEYLNLWTNLDSKFKKEEIERNMPVKYPLLWY